MDGVASAIAPAQRILPRISGSGALPTTDNPAVAGVHTSR